MTIEYDIAAASITRETLGCILGDGAPDLWKAITANMFSATKSGQVLTLGDVSIDDDPDDLPFWKSPWVNFVIKGLQQHDLVLEFLPQDDLIAIYRIEGFNSYLALMVKRTVFHGFENSTQELTIYGFTNELELFVSTITAAASAYKEAKSAKPDQ